MTTHGVPVPDRLLAPIDKAIAQGKWEEAKAILRKLEGVYPDALPVQVGLSRILRQLGDYGAALPYARRACAACPDNTELLVELGATLAFMGEEEAAPVLLKAVERDPRNRWAYHTLSNFYSQRFRWAEIEPLLDKLRAAGLAAPEFYLTHATALAEMARTEEAARVAGQAQMQFPSDRSIAEMACFCHNYIYPPDPKRSFQIHRNYGRILSQTLPRPAPLQRDASPARRLRVGVISSDLRQHAVARFMLPLLRNLDRDAFELVVLHHNGLVDKVSDEFKTLADDWRQLASYTYPAVADELRKLELDILVELNGITGGHALALLQLRLAPVQISYIGYPNTTGLETMDYRIVDSITDPAGAPYDAQEFATERLARMDPCFLCYLPPEGEKSPALAHRPLVGSDRPVVFGCFNATYKVNRYVLGLWARVLEAVPGSRLVYKSLALTDDLSRSMVEAQFRAAGLAPPRVEVLKPYAEISGHMAAYNGVDIALDTFPYHGTTTTCEALHMGVPVVTLQGNTHASRVGGSLLAAAGLPELVAQHEAEFVSIAQRLAADRVRLDDLHTHLRGRLAGSVLCDGPGAGARFGRLLRECWSRYCLGRTKTK